MNSHNAIVLFDGVCNLCNSLVLFIIKRDKDAKFKFASLQSNTAQSLLRKHNLPIVVVDSFVLIKDDTFSEKSSAGLYLLKEIGGLWKLLYIFILIPRPLRDFVYDKIANSRYKVFGKRDECMVPTDELKDRFLE